MELETQTQPEVTATAPIDTEVSTSETSGEIIEQPQWSPDYKLKVLDKEYEIDEFYRPLIKDEVTLKQVKRMQEQILGLPHIEAAREEYKAKYNQALPRVKEYEVVEGKLNRLSQYLQKEDLDSFFEDLKIPQEMVFKWMKGKASQESLDPQVRQRLDEARQQDKRAYEMSQELERYKQMEEQTQVAQSYQQIDSAIMQLSSDVANQFNERMQNPEAFRNAVLNKGVAMQQQFQAAGRMEKPQLQDVIVAVKNDLARVMGIVDGGAPSLQGQAPAVSAAKSPPVIPIIKAGSGSPVKQGPRSIEDLKKIAASL